MEVKVKVKKPLKIRFQNLEVGNVFLKDIPDFTLVYIKISDDFSKHAKNALNLVTRERVYFPADTMILPTEATITVVPINEHDETSHNYMKGILYENEN